jgi:F-type H+-transporting ATPase subunit epsilon
MTGVVYHLSFDSMTVDIITPDRKVYSGEATAVTFPGSEGQFQVLNDHAPLVSTLAQGAIVVQTPVGQQTFTVDGGVVEVLMNRVLVLAEAVIV